MRSSIKLMTAGIALAAALALPALADNGGRMMHGMGMGMGDADRGGACAMADEDQGGWRHHRHGMMHHGMMRGEGMGHGFFGGDHDRSAMMDDHLARLKDELAITDAQKPAWDAYAASVKARRQSMQGMRATMMTAMEKSTALERMDARIAMMEGQAQALKIIRPTYLALYDALTADQKKIADGHIACGPM